VTVVPGQGVKWLCYFASALTGLGDDDRERIFKDAAVVRSVCERVRAYLYEPHHYTDPKNNPDLSPERVYTIDHAQVSRSDIVVFHARHPSFGAGQELEIAAGAGVPVVLLVPRGLQVSRMVLGTYARLRQVMFDSSDELQSGFDALLEPVLSDLTVRRDNHTETAGTDGQTLGARIRKIRAGMRLPPGKVACLVGISDHAMRCLEDGSYTNPSIATLRRLAVVLRTSVSELVDGIPLRSEDTDPILQKSLSNLHIAARDLNTPAPLVEKLWMEYHSQYGEKRLKVAEARTEPASVEEWRAHIKRGTIVTNSSRQQGFKFNEDD
jgi:transcriptional regulator with XRE-family HTH domain